MTSLTAVNETKVWSDISISDFRRRERMRQKTRLVCHAARFALLCPLLHTHIIFLLPHATLFGMMYIYIYT